jgi:hypothetical protein
MAEELETEASDVEAEVADELYELCLVGESTQLLDRAAPLQSPNTL